MKPVSAPAWALAAAIVTCGLAGNAAAQTARALVIDATSTPPPAETGFLRLGANTSPGGHTIGATSRYLTRDGQPWLPVMGEMHFSRVPRAEWEEEILKMKAGGVDIVSAYVIWIHHEEVEGRFDWTGRRDLRAFAELCAKHGMYLYPRIGPWSHAEVRNGGFPDWLVHKVGQGLRSNDSTYLAYATRWYEQIGQQLKGLLWKDGGPVIGIQLENEYNGFGPGRGAEHILQLKRMALAAGFDVPLYTVTGWDNAALPPAEVIPVFGGYPDWPWDQSIEQLPPNENYVFRFANRWAGGRDAHNPAGTSQEALTRYPFLGVEYGPGIEDTYHRRPVIRPDDIGAMLPVQLGSGVNMYGYYMFHGGANPKGQLTTLMESQRTGYPTDVPTVSYDFQAPLSQYGEMRESFRRIKLVHYFLKAFGGDLAPMVVRSPDAVPSGVADTTVPRLSARTLGSNGFIFFNNYIRQYHMPDRNGVQVELRLPGETLHIPAAPVDVPSGAYFIWPVNLQVGGALLKYSTAQLLTRIGSGGDSVYVFFALPGIAPEFAFDAGTVASVEAPGATSTRDRDRIYVRGLKTGTAAAITVHPTNGPAVGIVLLSETEAENLWRGEFGGAERLVLSPQDVVFDSGRVHLSSVESPEFSVAVFPALGAAPKASAPLRSLGADGIFRRYAATLPARRPRLAVEKVREAATVPPVTLFNAVTWRHVAIALAPSDSAFDSSAAVWRLRVSPGAAEGSGDVLDIRYEGDVARLYSGGELLDDNFYNGTAWRIGLARFATQLRRGPLELRVLPLRSDAPIYIEPAYRPADFPASGQIARLVSARVLPRYDLLLTAAPPRRAP
jgi:beta-galactosidase